MTVSDSFLNNLDELIRSGEGGKVREILEGLEIGKIPRRQRASLAKISLRVGMSKFCLALFRDSRGHEGPGEFNLTSEELLQFGMAHKQVGAPDHALQIFNQIDNKKYPDSSLYSAITLFTQWRYREAIAHLENYLANSSLSDYDRLVGHINMGAALIIDEQIDRAKVHLQNSIELAKMGKFILLRGNALELMAQVHIYQRHFSQAEFCLQEGLQLVNKSAPAYHLFVKKWLAISEVYRTNAATPSLRQLDSVREEAIGMRHWETVRDCDFFFAVTKRDRTLFLRLYFGTPFPGYRERLVRHFPENVEIPEHFDWFGYVRQADRSAATVPVFDLIPTAVGVYKNKTKSQNLSVRILRILSRDFYAPIKPYSLYLSLFPNERLDPIAANPKIFTAIGRAKRWIEDSRLPFQIENDNNGYRLFWDQPFVLRIPKDLDPTLISADSLAHLKKHFSTMDFSSSEAANVLNLSKRSALHLLNRAVKEGTLIVSGAGRRTRYHFGPKSQSAA